MSTEAPRVIQRDLSSPQTASAQRAKKGIRVFDICQTALATEGVWYFETMAFHSGMEGTRNVVASGLEALALVMEY